MQKPPTGRFLHFRTDAVRFEGLGLQAQPSPNRPTAAAARQLRAPRARFCSAAADLTPVCGCFGAPKIANITG